LKTWDEVKSNTDSLTKEEIEEIEIMSRLVGKMIEKN